jgi:hypothetical protein
MADTVKLPAIGPVKKQWVYAGGALVAGIVAYAWWSRGTRGEEIPVPAQPIPEDYAGEFLTEGREAPPTIVGGGSFDDTGAGSIINTNTEWFTAAVAALTESGYDTITAVNTLGKFLSRRPLSASERQLVQAAKGFVGEPPLGGPWPIIDELPPPATTPPPSSGGGTKLQTSWHGTRLTADTTWIALARARASKPSEPNSVEATKRAMFARNPTIVARIGTRNAARLKRGWIVVVPIHRRVAA